MTAETAQEFQIKVPNIWKLVTALTTPPGKNSPSNAAANTFAVGMLMNSRNSSQNRLQMMLGVFLRANNVQFKIIAQLSRCGLSVSIARLNSAFETLSNHQEMILRKRDNPLPPGVILVYDSILLTSKVLNAAARELRENRRRGNEGASGGFMAYSMDAHTVADRVLLPVAEDYLHESPDATGADSADADMAELLMDESTTLDASGGVKLEGNDDTEDDDATMDGDDTSEEDSLMADAPAIVPDCVE